MKPVSMLPNLLTLANAGCGLLAISKGIDALVGDPAHFERTLETACWLVFLAMIFDAFDGALARRMHSFSDFGAQLDSLADALTFGVAPALLAKVLIEHEGGLHPRLHFLASASFALMALLRLARFNLETDRGDDGSHSHFRGLPSPAAAGTVTATVLMYLSLAGGIEVADGEPTPLGKGLAFLPEGARESLVSMLLPMLAFLLPLLGLLMVSHIRYPHATSVLFRQRGKFPTLVGLVFLALLLFSAPVPFLFVLGTGYVGFGLAAAPFVARQEARVSEREA